MLQLTPHPVGEEALRNTSLLTDGRTFQLIPSRLLVSN